MSNKTMNTTDEIRLTEDQVMNICLPILVGLLGNSKRGIKGEQEGNVQRAFEHAREFIRQARQEAAVDSW